MSRRSGFLRLRASILGRDVRRRLLPASILVGFVLVFVPCLLTQVTLLEGLADVEACS